MKKNIPYLQHMIVAMDEIDRYVALRLDDGMTRSAIYRQLEILGEAANRLGKEFHTRYPEIPWRQMIATRNVLIHLYDGIDDEIIHTIVRDELPNLRLQLDVILAKES